MNQLGQRNSFNSVSGETVDKLLEAIYEQYPEGASSMPSKLEEAVINTLHDLEDI